MDIHDASQRPITRYTVAISYDDRWTARSSVPRTTSPTGACTSISRLTISQSICSRLHINLLAPITLATFPNQSHTDRVLAD